MGHKPLYRQIADRIREQIARGELKPGDALPTESALQTEFGVSRVTVRQALRQLVEQQILESIQGSGTYVKEERVNYDIFQLTSFDEKLSDRHVDTHSEVLIFEVIPADDFLQQQLQITAQDRVWHVKRVRYRLLNISQTKPILEKVSRGYLVDGRVFEYSRNAFNTDDYKFTLIAQRKSSR